MIKDNTTISGVICEFNPLHKGHKYLLSSIKKEFGGITVCVMSGNFVQRGDVAIIDKWDRTRLALKYGADLVVELPIPYAISGAESFARGAVDVLNNLGVVDKLVFGSECGSTDKLSYLSDFLLSEEFTQEIIAQIKLSLNFAKAREEVISRNLGKEYGDIIASGNNILGTEYIKAIKTTHSKIQANTIFRQGAGHDEIGNNKFASASHIRKNIVNKEEYLSLLPSFSAEITKKLIDSGSAPASLDKIFLSILSRIRRNGTEAFRDVTDVSEGIENKIVESAYNSTNLQELYMNIKSKRYSHARIRRIILNSYLGIKKEHLATPPYLRILGMNSLGAKVISSEMSSLPFVMNYSDAKKLGETAVNYFDFEARINDQYSLCLPNLLKGKRDYTEKFIFIN